jgi:predicted pyridoxine 5'-phosphate oxidase superfamily flavin-nucleotide-binding protein
MFSKAAKRLQARYGSAAAYQKMAERGEIDDALGEFEEEFIASRDSFYLASVNEDGSPYIQHRGGPAGFLKVLNGRTIGFADFAGNKQYITAGNLATNDRVALFLMDYPERARLKMIGHARIVEMGANAELEAKLRVEAYRAPVERMMLIDVTAYDWNCSQHITPRWTEAELQVAQPGRCPSR